MEKRPILWLVSTECPKEKEFNEWYNKVHVPMILKVPGVLGAKRYETVQPGPPKYLALYELADESVITSMETAPEMLAARAEKNESWGKTGFTVLRKEFYRPIG